MFAQSPAPAFIHPTMGDFAVSHQNQNQNQRMKPELEDEGIKVSINFVNVRGGIHGSQYVVDSGTHMCRLGVGVYALPDPWCSSNS